MLQEPKLSPKYAAVLRVLHAASEAVEEDASDVDTLTSVLLSKADQEDGELRTEHAVDVLVVVLRAKECEQYEEDIKKLISLITQRPLGYQEWRRVSGALADASKRGKRVGHLRRMLNNRRNLQARTGPDKA